jgi:hypothetical protein
MNRRFFHRVDVRANGELLWATRTRLGRVSTHREYITTDNVSVSGAKIALKGKHDFPLRSRARLKLGLEFCDVEVLQIETVSNSTVLRLAFLTPNSRFITIVEQWLPISTNDREEFVSAWT